MIRSLTTAFAFLFSTVSLFAVGREAIGYGTGDDLAQAISVAEGDAVLNAGGRASFEAEVKKDQLLKDTGFISNEVYLVSSALIESGDSFDGTYARVKVRVTDVEDTSKKDGVTTVEGEGRAKTKDAATILALGDMVVKAGKKIRAYGKFENEELVKDETTLLGSGFVREYRIVATSNIANECYVRIAASLTPYATEGVTIEAGGVSGRGVGRTLAEAMAMARKTTASASGAGYQAERVFSSGTLTQDALEKSVAGDLAKSSIAVSAVGNDMEVRISSDGGGSSVDGYGLSQADDNLYELARADAVINVGSRYKLATRYDHGYRTGDSLNMSGSTYLRVLNEEKCEGGVHVEGTFGESLQDVLGDEIEFVSGRGIKGTLQDAYFAAKYDAIIRSSAKIDAQIEYENESLKACSVASEGELACRGVKVSNTSESTDGYVVDVVSGFASALTDAYGAANESEGWGFAEDENTALILARADALMNRAGRVTKRTRYTFGKGLVGDARVSARGYVGPILKTDTIARGRSIFALVGGSEGQVRQESRFRVRGIGEGESISEAMAVARCDAVSRAGMMIDGSVAYDNGKGRYGVVTGTSSADIRGVYNSEFRETNGRYYFAGDFELANAGKGGAPCCKVKGYGLGNTLVAARKAARYEAALSACSSAALNYRVNGDSPCTWQSDIASSCVLIEDEIDMSQVNGQILVKADAKIEGTYRSMGGYKETVRAKGYGSTKELALKDAERNAIDKVFGRKLTVTAKWCNGDVPSYDFTETPFADGYTESSKEKSAISCCDGWCVDAEVVVRQRARDEEHGIFWYLWRAIVWIVCGIFKLIWWIIKAIWWIICAIFNLIF